MSEKIKKVIRGQTDKFYSSKCLAKLRRETARVNVRRFQSYPEDFFRPRKFFKPQFRRKCVGEKILDKRTALVIKLRVEWLMMI